MWLRWILFWIVIAGTVIDVGAQTLTLDTLKYGGGDGVGFDRSGIFYTVVAVGPEKACSGEELVFNVEVIGAEYYTYRWKYNGDFLSLGKTLVLKDVTETQTGKYWCEISDPGGRVKVKSREFDLVVSHTPVFELSASKQSILKGDSTCLKARGDAANTYLWDNGQVADSIWVKPLLSERYMVTASNGTRCHSTKDISVEVEDFEIEYQRFNYIARGGETLLKVKSKADSVQWYEMGASYLRSALTRTYLATGDSIVVSPEETTDYEALFYYNTYRLSRTLTVDVRQPQAFGGGDGDGVDFSALYFKADIAVSSNPVCENAAAVFRAIPIGMGNYTYSWRKIGKDGTLSDSSVLVVDPVLPQDSGRYYCVLTEPQGKFSVSTDTLYLDVIAKPEVVIVSPLADTTICYGDVAVLRGKALGTDIDMTWSGQNMIGVPILDYVEVAPLSYQKYVLTGEREGCFYTDTVGVSVVDSRIDIPSVFHLTNGVQQSVSALSLAGDTLDAEQVNWYMNGILSAEKVNPYTFYAWNDMKLTAEYTTMGTACKFRDSAQVFVRSLEPYAGGDNDGFTRNNINFGLTTNIDPNPVCEGETVSFYTTASGIESYTYKWYKVGVATPLEESCCLTLDAVTLSDSGLYYCEVMSKGAIAMDPDTIRLVVHPRPQISFDCSLKDTTICYGNLLVLKGNSSLPDSKFSWSGNAIEGNAYTDVVKVRPLERTEYLLTVEKNGCVATDTFVVDVNDSRIYLPDVYNATHGEMVMFTAENGLGDTVPSSGLKWYIGNVLCGEKVNPFSKLVANQETIRAEYTNGYCVFTDSTRVLVKQDYAFHGGENDGFSRTNINFGVALEITPNPVCQYEAVSFEAQTMGIETYKYHWYKVGIADPIKDSCCFTIESADLSDAGLYYCAITDKNNKMMALDTLELVVRERPVPTIDPTLRDTVVCYGEKLTLHGTSSVPEAKFIWSGADLIGNPYAESIEVMPLENQKYILTVEKDGCRQMDTVSVFVNDSRIVLPEIYSATEGEMIMISAHSFTGDTVSSANIQWYIGNSLVGDQVNPLSYLAVQQEVVKAEYTSGRCVFIDSTLVVVKKNYAFYGGDDDGYSRTALNFGMAVEVDPNPVCEYSPVKFTARTTGIENYNYHWYKVGIADPIKDSCCFTIESADLSDAGLYYCAITDGNAKKTVLDTIELIVNERPEASVVSATRDTMICYGDKIVLNGMSSLPESHFVWTGEAITTNENNASIVVNPLESQEYVLTVEKEGCFSTDTMWVSVNDHRIFLPDSYIGVEGDLVEFIGLDKVQDTLPAEGVVWYKDNDLAGIEVNPVNFLLTKDVNLKATYTFEDCTFADSVKVLVKKNFSFKGGEDDGYSRTALNFGLTVEVDPNPVCEYSPAKFTARTTGIETYSYHWYKVGIADPIKDSCCFTIDSTHLSDAGLYYCKITDKNNKITFVDTVQLTVHELPLATILLSARDTTICFKDSITLAGNSSVPGAVLTWQNTTVGGVVEDQTIRVCPSDSTSYILNVRNYNCETKDTVWVNVNRPYVSIPDIVYASERGDVTLWATDRKGDLIQVDPVEKNMEWTVSGVNKGVVNPLKLRALTQDELVELRYTDEGCPIKDTTLIKMKGGYTYVGGFDDGFACSDTTQREVYLVFSGGGKYCEGDSAMVRLQLVGEKSPWNVTIKRGSDGSEATEIVANYPLTVYNQDTVLHFEILNDERYYVVKVAEDTLSLGAKDTVEVKQILPSHIDFCTGWPTSVGYCRDVNLLDSLRPSINGLYVGANDIIFYVDSVTLDGIVWEVGDFTQGYHTVRCEVMTDSTCPAVSDEINIRLDSIPVGRISLPEVYCEGADTMMEIHLYAGPQDYTIDLVQYRYRKGDTLPQIRSRQIKLAAANNGVYQENLKWNTVGAPDSCQIFKITKITDSHGCITDISTLSPAVGQYYYTDTAWWYQKIHAILQTRYPATAAWTSGEHLFYLPEGDTLEVKLSLMTGSAPWYVINNEVNYYSIQGKDTLFKLGNEGLYRFKALDKHCEMNVEELDSVQISYLQRGYFRGRLWLEGAYDSSRHQMISSISSKLLSHYGMTRWPEVNGEVIDMVEIELREANSADIAADTTALCNVITRDTCLLLSDGRLADRFTGDTLVGLRNGYRDDDNEYYMVVTHRNHLGIMTAAPVKIVKNSEKTRAAMVDFTVQNNIYCKDCAGSREKLACHMTFVDGQWMMAVGELNKNDLISLSDDNRIGHLLGEDIDTTIYDLLYDVNFDGIVDWSLQAGNESDWLIVKKNRGKYSEIMKK